MNHSYATIIDSLAQELSLLEGKESLNELDQQAILCNEIAIKYQDIGDQKNARIYYLQSIYFAKYRIEKYNLKDAQSFYDIGYLYKNISTFESTLKNFDKAIGYFEEAEKSYLSLANLLPPEEYRAMLPGFYNSYAVLFYHASRFEEAKSQYEKALNLMPNKEDKRYLEIRRQYGEVLVKLKEKDKAKSIFRQCLSDFSRLYPGDGDIHSSFYSLIAVLYNSGEYEALLEEMMQYAPYNNIGNLVEYAESRSDFEVAKIINNIFVISFAYSQLGERNEDTYHYEQAYRWQFIGFELAEKYAIQSNVEKLGSVIQNPENKVLAILISCLNLDQYNLLTQEKIQQVIRIIDVYQSTQLHYERISFEQNAALWEREKELKNQIKYYNIQLENIVLDENDLEEVDSIRALIYEVSMELSDIRAIAKKDVILAEYQLGQEKFGELITDHFEKEEKDLLVYFNTADRDSLFILGYAQSKYFMRVAHISDQFKSEIHENYKLNSQLNTTLTAIEKQVQSNQKFYRYMLDPVIDLLDKKGLVIYPLGELSYISVDALQDQQKEYAVNQFSIQYTSSLFSIINQQSSRQLGGSISFYPSKYGTDDLAYLHYAEKEINAIEGLMLTENFLDDSATKYNFIQSANGKKSIHIASHAILDFENPYGSYIIFNKNNDTVDYKLFAYEIFSLTVNADLVTLSTCNSGHGVIEEGVGTLSLANAFYFAGVPATVSSLWSAQDQSSADIMTGFYTNLKEGKGKSESLQAAKLAYLKESDAIKSQPFFWANYVMYGSDQPIFKKEKSKAYLYWIFGILFVASSVFFYYKFSKRS